MLFSEAKLLEWRLVVFVPRSAQVEMRCELSQSLPAHPLDGREWELIQLLLVLKVLGSDGLESPLLWGN